MNHKLFSNYRKIAEQAWFPIFVKDEFDTEILFEGCRLAGLRVIEYTLRREDAAKRIPTLRKEFPDAVILVGSTIDSERIVKEWRKRYPQLMTLEELAPYADGFVSMLPYSNETLQTYSPSHLCIPAAETGGEALRQMDHGAAFIKVLGPDFSFSKRLHAAPTFGYCPTYITGGVTPERMKEVFEAGNLMCASGFDLLLKGVDPADLTAELVAERIAVFTDAAKKARAEVFPALANAEALSDEEFRAALPNYCSIL
ncbi:MAG: hypothetical protein IKA76_02685 [Clostridia bacterium]|nr:hypothetical protein [Clostridia bacterium]